jgi:hypothetical protein
LAFTDRPIVGICHSASGFNNCHRHLPEVIEAVKRGVLSSGALPIEFPTISLGELFLVPTSLKFRNLMSMDIEEMIRAQPMDAVVLVGGCDTAQLMGAASADLPTRIAGAMSAGVRLRKLSREDIHFLDGGWRCEELRCFGHQRCSDFAREMSLPTRITWKCVNDSERGLIHPNREPRHRLRLFFHERQSAAQEYLDIRCAKSSDRTLHRTAGPLRLNLLAPRG